MTNSIKCLVVDDEPVAREILESYIQKFPNLELVKSCKNAMEAFEIISSQKIDLFFLDINMPEVSGLTLAKSIGKEAKVIFTTAYRDYAVDGFDLQAVDYLLKPISFDRFLTAVHKFFDTNFTDKKTENFTKSEEQNKFIFVRSDRKMVKINFDEILYVESLSDYVKIHFLDKNVLTRETISNIESKLPKNDFLRIHRSYIVAIKKIKSYTNEFVEIHNKACPISRSYKEAVLDKLAIN